MEREKFIQILMESVLNGPCQETSKIIERIVNNEFLELRVSHSIDLLSTEEQIRKYGFDIRNAIKIGYEQGYFDGTVQEKDRIKQLVKELEPYP